MAAQIMDSDFLLPKDFFMPEKKPQMQHPNDVPANLKQKKDFFCFPDEFPYDFHYDSSITETEESDEEDPSYNMLAAALTQKMAHSFILNQDDNIINQKSPHAQVSSNISFPASTLQPNTADTNLRNTVKDCQDLLFRQHGVAEKMRRKVVGAPAPTPQPPNNSSVSTGVYYPNPALNRRQLQVNQFHELKHQQMLRLQQQCSAAWGRHNRARRGFGIVNNHNHVANGRPLGLSSSAWPPLQPPRHIQQQQQGSGMRAVFLGAPNTGKPTCSGTGVFLPRCAGAPNDVPKKPSCSTVLLPARVVQALNLNLEDLGPPGRFPVSFVLDHDKVMARNNSSNPAMMSQKKGLRLQPPPGSMNTHYELRLPQEWSY